MKKTQVICIVKNSLCCTSIPCSCLCHHMEGLKKPGRFGVIFTTKGNNADFVSRFFALKDGVMETRLQVPTIVHWRV